MTEKLLPHDVAAEEAVIGSLLIDGDAIRLIENIIKPSDFYVERNALVYSACVALRERRETLDQVTISQELTRTGKAESSGGVAYLDHLISVCPTSLDAEDYANVIRRLSVSRQMIDLGKRMAEVGYNRDPDTNNAIDKISGMLSDWKKSVTIYNDIVMPKDVGNKLIDMMEKYNSPRNSMSWGFRTLDDLTSGIYPELIIIGARPGTGKTQIMVDIAESVAMNQKKVLFCTAEMSTEAILERKISRNLRVDIKNLRRHGVPDELSGSYAELAGVASETPICYLTQGCSSSDIYNQAVKLKETFGLDIVFVDYLQILRDCWQQGRENKSTLVGRASKTLKAIVNDLNIPVICASQLNRDLERRSEETKKPVLADLRESGDIEQDADVVFLLWRDMSNIDEAIRNTLDVKMAKNRQLGDALAVKLIWSDENHRYYDCYQG